MNKKEIININKRPEGIFEIETFEKPLRAQIVELEQENKQLKEQLTKKDKEIEELKEHIKFLEKKCLNEINVKLVNVTKEKMQQIREQVCEEFKKAIITESIFDTEEEARYWTDDIDVKTILEIIDKIEKGE